MSVRGKQTNVRTPTGRFRSERFADDHGVYVVYMCLYSLNRVSVFVFFPEHTCYCSIGLRKINCLN